MRIIDKKYSVIALESALIERGWNGRFYGYFNTVTYINDNNETLATVHYYPKSRTKIKHIEWGES